MASRHGEGRVVSLLEGGYNLDNLGRTVHDQHRRPGRVSVGALCERTYTHLLLSNHYRSRELGVVLQAGHLLVQAFPLDVPVFVRHPRN